MLNFINHWKNRELNGLKTFISAPTIGVNSRVFDVKNNLKIPMEEEQLTLTIRFRLIYWKRIWLPFLLVMIRDSFEQQFSLNFSISFILINSVYLALRHSRVFFIILSKYVHIVKSTTRKLQHKAYFLIQLSADSLYPSACWYLCLLCILIQMLIILMLILIESRSMLIVYW